MQQQTGNPRNTSSILPLVVAAFAGATLAIACERPGSSASVGSPPPAAQERVAAQPPAAPARADAPIAAAATTDALSDTVISGRIKAAILTDPAMAGADVSVITDRGAVSLMGTVKSHEQAGIASAHAQRQDGVMRVDSHLSAIPG